VLAQKDKEDLRRRVRGVPWPRKIIGINFLTGGRMARRPVQRYKVLLVCLSLGCLAIPVWAALGGTPICPAAVSINDAAGPDAVPRSAGCPAIAAGWLSYDSKSDRCVQGGGGGDLHTP